MEADNLYIISYCVKYAYNHIHVNTVKRISIQLKKTMAFEKSGKNQSAGDFLIAYINYFYTDKIFLETCPNYIKKTWSGNQLFSKYESNYKEENLLK